MKDLCIEYVNSKWYITHEIKSDPFDDEQWWITFCDKWKLPIPNIESQEVMSKLRQLRFIIEGLINEITISHTLTEKHLKTLNNYLTSLPFNYELIKEDKTFELDVKMNHDHTETLYVSVVMSVIKLITEFDLLRVKCCNNPECNWFFYDKSKNQSQKWCDSTCANLMRVRKFRTKSRD
jgi:predicted RNA-binding Zn ribbon-like protein